jgi:hypothetical protein
MRTTPTLDDDLAARLQSLRASSDKSLRELVSDALGQGSRSSIAPSSVVGVRPRGWCRWAGLICRMSTT